MTQDTATTTSREPARGTTTRAAVIDAYGGPDLLRVTDLPLAPPGDRQVQVRVAAAAVNPVDLSTRAGLNIPVADARFPMVLGWDVAGTVTATGRRATGWAVGDRVAAMVFQPLDQRGTYSAAITLDVDLLARVPAGLALDRAATVPLAGLTAAQLLRSATDRGARTLLVDGPLGAVGRHLVQLAAAAGVAVVGVVRPEQEVELLALGAVLAVPRGEPTPALRRHHPGGVDAAVDLVGGTTARSALDAVRDGGRYVTAVPPFIDPSGPFADERGIAVEVLTVHPDQAELTALLELAATGALHTAIAERHPLERAARAQRRQAEGGLTGRVMIVP